MLVAPLFMVKRLLAWSLFTLDSRHGDGKDTACNQEPFATDLQKSAACMCLNHEIRNLVEEYMGHLPKASFYY
jgi:hypothetical protein